MTWIRLPINVIVIHRTNHVTIDKGGIYGISFETGDECCRITFSTPHHTVMLEQNLRIILLTAAKRAADGIKPE